MADNELDKVMFSYTHSTSQAEEENRVLRDTVNRMRTELDRYREPALMVCEVHDIIKTQAIIKVPNGNMFYVNISKKVKGLQPGDMVLVEQKNLTVVDIIRTSKKFNVEKFVIMEKPTLTWNDIGGLADQKQEIQEVIELPLNKPELFRNVGIQPPKGVLLYGEPGTGKTLMAKAVAQSTKATFIEVVGSELVQKFIGEGAKLVKDIFNLARAKAPSIIFIDEIDALASKRIELGTSGEREVQRTFMQFLAEVDGFKPLDNVKVIGATNRKDILDPAIIRPGRLDRLIQVPLPDKEGRRAIFKIHSAKMKSKELTLSKIISSMEGFSGAEIRAVCTEAGYFAIRQNRSVIEQNDYLQAIKKVRKDAEQEGEDYLGMFG